MAFLSNYIVGISITIYALYYYRCYTFHVAKAKQSGLPYVVVPIHMISIYWYLINYRWALPLLRRLPESLTGLWLEYVLQNSTPKVRPC